MLIPNPTPQTVGAFLHMWVTNLQLKQPDPTLPANQSRGSFFASLLPYDGANLLHAPITVTIPALSVRMTTDTVFAGVVTSLLAEAQRQAGSTLDVKSLIITAPKPPQVHATVQFVDNTTFTISDCFALCKTDTIFAEVFESALVEVARQAGLTPTPDPTPTEPTPTA